MNRTIKDATISRYYHESHGQIRTHLKDLVAIYRISLSNPIG